MPSDFGTGQELYGDLVLIATEHTVVAHLDPADLRTIAQLLLPGVEARGVPLIETETACRVRERVLQENNIPHLFSYNTQATIRKDGGLELRLDGFTEAAEDDIEQNLYLQVQFSPRQISQLKAVLRPVLDILVLDDDAFTQITSPAEEKAYLPVYIPRTQEAVQMSSRPTRYVRIRYRKGADLTLTELDKLSRPQKLLFSKISLLASEDAFRQRILPQRVKGQKLRALKHPDKETFLEQLVSLDPYRTKAGLFAVWDELVECGLVGETGRQIWVHSVGRELTELLINPLWEWEMALRLEGLDAFLRTP